MAGYNWRAGKSNNAVAAATGTTCLAAQSHSTSEPRAKDKHTDPIAGKTNRETLPRFGYNIGIAHCLGYAISCCTKANNN